MGIVVTEGDSLTAGYGVASSGNYPAQLAALMPTWTVANVGQNSAALTGMTTRATSQVDSLHSAGGYIVLWGGTNDMYAGASAATAYSRYVAYCQARQAVGWNVVAVTVLPRSHAGLPADFESSRQTFNANIRSNWPTFADALADVASDTRIGDLGAEENTAYYLSDLVHLNSTGYSIVANIVHVSILEFLGVLGMAASDARPIPRKNTAFRVTFPIFDADGDLVTGAAGLGSEVSIDGGTFSDCTNEATEIATSSGMYYLDLTSGELNGDTVTIIVKTSTSGAKTTPIIIYPEEAGDVRVAVVSIADNAITASAIASDAITAAKVASDAVAEIQSGLATPTNITAGTITTVTNLTNAPTSGDLTATMKTSVTTAATAATPTVAAVTGNVGGNIVGSVASVTAGVTLADSAITAAKIASDAITAAKVAADAVAEIQGGLATAAALATVDTNVAAILADTGADGVVVASGSKAGYSLASDQSGVTVGTVNALGTQAKADVNAQVVDTLSVDTYAEPTSTPSATASLVAKIGWLMKLARNKLTQNSTTQTLYADDGTTAQNTAAVTDDGDVFTKGEWS